MHLGSQKQGIMVAQNGGIEHGRHHQKVVVRLGKTHQGSNIIIGISLFRWSASFKNYTGVKLLGVSNFQEKPTKFQDMRILGLGKRGSLPCDAWIGMRHVAGHRTVE